MKRVDVQQKLASKTKYNATSGCLEWVGLRNKDGYGRVCLHGKVYLAHRMAYVAHFGDIGDGVVCHTCDNPACVLVSHLFLGTQADNIRDCKTKGRLSKTRVRGEKHGNAKFTDDEIRSIKTDILSGMPKRLIMAKYPALGRGTYESLMAGRSWQHVAVEVKS